LKLKQCLLDKKGVYFATHYAKNASLHLDQILFRATIYPQPLRFRGERLFLFFDLIYFN
tara:strand:+ start:512 stop:688 length:177 start_codon:yes stop_codon:yes gene_type:complete